MILKSVITAALVIMILTTPNARGDYWYGDFIDNTTHVFSSNAVLFTAPDLDSQAIMRIPIGSDVEITGSDGEDIFQNSMPSYWYEVTYEDDNAEYTGFMPGVYLAMTGIELGIDTLFLFNVIGYLQEEDRYIASARIIISGEITAEQEFQPVGGGFGHVPYAYCVRGTELNAEGLNSIRNLIELSFIYGACGYLNRDILVAWISDELIMGPKADSMFESGIFRFIETFIIPSDSSGIQDEVTVLTSISGWDEEIDNYTETENSSAVYHWNGNAFDFPDVTQ